ncbi:MAG: response regulator transcription factor [Cellvibrionales bacterium]|nr:response regulator transcription factor [Cellvibrionales bacterium]
MNRTVLVVDDEPLARRRLRDLLAELPGFACIGEAGDGPAALALARQHRPDLLLLDIAMPGMSGLEVAAHLANLATPPAVVFCTAHDQHAVQAFEAAAVGYLLKPVRPQQLAATLARATQLSRLQRRQLEEMGGEFGPRRTHLTVRSHRGVVRLEIAQISHFVAEDGYVFAHHAGGQTLLEQSLKALAEQLGDRFVRIHRNALVAIDQIQALERVGGATYVRLRGSEERPLVSRRHRQRLMQRLAES